MGRVGIIILNYNGFDETNKLAQSILSWDPSKLDFNVIIVDNCSSDDSFTRLKMHYSDYTRFDVIKSDKNGGYSYGNNYGAQFAIDKYRPDYIIISNPDVEIEQDMIIHLLNTFSLDKRIGMCAPVMKSLDGTYRIYSQKLPEYRDDLRACFIWNKPESLIDKNYTTLDSDEDCIVTEMVPGSFFAIRTDCFLKIGMFDEGVFLYCEERIIGKRLKDAGYIGILRADLSYVHAHAVTTSKVIKTVKRWELLLSSRLYYQKKYEKIEGLRLWILKAAMKSYLLQIMLLSMKSK